MHSKKRDRLLQQKLNDHVFIQYNKKLKKRSTKRNKSYDPIVLRKDDENDDWAIPIEEEHQGFIDIIGYYYVELVLVLKTT